MRKRIVPDNFPGVRRNTQFDEVVLGNRPGRGNPNFDEPIPGNLPGGRRTPNFDEIVPGNLPGGRRNTNFAEIALGNQPSGRDEGSNVFRNCPGQHSGRELSAESCGEHRPHRRRRRRWRRRRHRRRQGSKLLVDVGQLGIQGSKPPCAPLRRLRLQHTPRLSDFSLRRWQHTPDRSGDFS